MTQTPPTAPVPLDFDPADPVALTQALVRCPSVTPAEGGALALLDAVLSAEGFEVARPVFSEPGMPDVENLYARIGSGGPCSSSPAIPTSSRPATSQPGRMIPSRPRSWTAFSTAAAPAT